MRRFAIGFVLALTSGHNAMAWDSPAPDVVLYCTPAMETALGQVASLFTAKHHIAVHLFGAPPDGLLGLLRHRARSDVVVSDAMTMRELAAGGLVRSNTIVTLGGDPFVLISKAGAAIPPGTAVAQLLAARATVVPDPTTAASFDGAAVLRTAVPDLPVPHLIGVSDTPTVLVTLRGDDGLLGLVYRTEAHAPGVSQVAILPGPATPMSGALVVKGQSAHSAELLDFIAGPDGEAVLHAAGLEPAS